MCNRLNSAGKSSIIHSVLLAKHAQENGELDVHRTPAGGDSVDLGGFQQYVYRHDLSQWVEWGVDFSRSGLAATLADSFQSVDRLGASIEIGLEQEELKIRKLIVDPVSRESKWAEVPSGKLQRVGNPEVRTFAVSCDGQPILQLSRSPDRTLRVNRLDHEHSVFRRVIEAVFQTATTTESLGPSDWETVSRTVGEIITGLRSHVVRLFPESLYQVEASSGPERVSVESLYPISKGRRQEDLAAALKLFLPRALNALFAGVAQLANDQLARVQYLGPLRSYPPRHIAFAQHHDPNWYAGGGYAWDIVRKDEQVRAAVNAWLTSEGRLQTPYELVVRDLVGVDELDRPIFERLQQFVDEFERLQKATGPLAGTFPMLEDPEASAVAFRDSVQSSNLEKIKDLVLMDRRSGTVVSHRDVGIGVSQVLPVLVAAYASRNKILAMEQPEIHLHPALQAELGDLFIESALGEHANTFILETHSEHIMLRILRRIRETTDGELPQGLPTIRPEQVAVLYVEPLPTGARVQEIPILPDGEFAEKWPQGFFAERAKELF